MELKYSPKAKEDLIDIKRSILDEFGSEEVAIKVLKEITKTARSLVLFPNMGKKVSGFTNVFTEYRVAYCAKNYIFYRVEADNILVTRILNERRDYMRILFGITEVEE